MKPSVRRVTDIGSGLISQVAALEADVFGRGGLNKWHLPVIIRYGRLYVIELDGNVIGAAELIKSWDEPRDAYLIGFSISKRFQGQGYGRRLLRDIVIETKEAGMNRLSLTVDEKNSAALALYQESGFKLITRLQNEYGSGIDRLLMELDLAEVAVE